MASVVEDFLLGTELLHDHKATDVSDGDTTWLRVDGSNSPTTGEVTLGDDLNVGVTASESNLISYLVINEDMTSSPSGTIKNDATYDATNDYVVLTTATNGQQGQLEYTLTNKLPDFDARFNFSIGDGNGADAMWLYMFADSTPASEDQNVGGFAIVFDDNANQIQLKYEGSNITTYNLNDDSIDIDDGVSRLARITYVAGVFKIYLDGDLKITQDDSANTRDTSGTLFGMAARTGGLNNAHILESLQIGMLEYKDINFGDAYIRGRDSVHVLGGNFGINTSSAPNELTVNGNYLLRDSDSSTKAYRFRTTGGALDLEGAGQPLYLSVWANGDFTGAQRNKMVLENGANVIQLIDAVQFRNSPNGDTYHTIDGSGGVVFNEIGGDNDLRVEGNNVTDLLKVDAGNDQVEINGGFIANVTTVNQATYDLLTTDYIINVTYTSTGAVTSLTLPTAQTVQGRVVIIKDAGGNATANNITIDTQGSETIDGASTLPINSDYGSVRIYSDGSNWFTY